MSPSPITAGSPSSLPSIAETSYASSPDEPPTKGCYMSNSRRALFRDGGEDDDDHDDDEEEEGGRSHRRGTSIAPSSPPILDGDGNDCRYNFVSDETSSSSSSSSVSSRTTTIPGWNLTAHNSEHNNEHDDDRYPPAGDTTQQQDVEVPLNQYYYRLSSMSMSSPTLLTPPSALTASSTTTGRARLRHPWKQQLQQQQQHNYHHQQRSADHGQSSRIHSRHPTGREAALETASPLETAGPSSLSAGQEAGSTAGPMSRTVRTSDKEDDFGRAHQTIHSQAAQSPSPSSRGPPSPVRMVAEEPEPEAASASCSSALNLTPRQLAEIFLALGGQTMSGWQQQQQQQRQEAYHQPRPTPAATNSAALSIKSPSSSPPPPPPASPLVGLSSPRSDCSILSQNSDGSGDGWNATERSFLERECAALKKLVDQDASTISNLKGAVEAQKQLNALKEVEIVDRQAELRIAEDRIARLTKARDGWSEREMVQVETIRILKEEVDKLTSRQSTEKRAISVSDPERTAMELALSSAQIAEQEVRIEELETNLKQSEEAKQIMQTEINRVVAQQSQSTSNEKEIEECTPSLATHHTEEVDENRGQEIALVGLVPSYLVDLKEERENCLQGDHPVISTSSLALDMEDLSRRLAELEKDKRERDELVLAEAKANRRKTEDNSGRGFLSLESGESVVKVSSDPEEIEAMPAIKKKETNLSHVVQPNCCCDWSFVSGD